ERMAEVLRAMREATSLPLIAQPHAGLPESRGKTWVYPLDPEAMVRHIPVLLASNQGILGGCCGTTPAHLEAVVRSLRHP
ncbi:MAG: homocysteine S-methyltransferase family protein, partial [candidate division NC10 bacterium]